jgi:hypothetical protein
VTSPALCSHVSSLVLWYRYAGQRSWSSLGGWETGDWWRLWWKTRWEPWSEWSIWLWIGKSNQVHFESWVENRWRESQWRWRCESESNGWTPQVVGEFVPDFRSLEVEWTICDFGSRWVARALESDESRWAGGTCRLKSKAIAEVKRFGMLDTVICDGCDLIGYEIWLVASEETVGQGWHGQIEKIW